MRRLTTLVLATSALASAACAEPPPFEILKATDKDLTCEQLATEYNHLIADGEKAKAAELAKAQKSQSSSVMLGMATGLAGGLLGGGRGGGFGVFGASGLSQAASAANMAGAQARRSQIMSSAMAGMLGPQTGGTPQQQRSQRLMQLYQSKGC